MENSEEDDDLILVKASGILLTDLEDALPKLLWKPAKNGNARKVHSLVKRGDLDHVTRLIEPFQGEPQLLDVRLRHILPPIVNSYLTHIQCVPTDRKSGHCDIEAAVCSIWYTLCKVRGYKVILGFLNNEPRYLEPILCRLEAFSSHEQTKGSQWQVPYVLLLWLSHLLLTPFDLASISDRPAYVQLADGEWPPDLPPVASRILTLGLNYLPASSKAQDAASILLARLVKRPDMQQLKLGDKLVTRMLGTLSDRGPDAFSTVYERLGPLRVLSAVVATPELSQLVPRIYNLCRRLSEEADSFVATNGVAKKLVVKVFRDIGILSLRSEDVQGPLLNFFEITSVLEDVIDYLLRSLGDRDTPVRFAAAKAISVIVLELDPEMREEVVQAVLDTFREDMPRGNLSLDFRTADPLRWHGLTLCLGHTLFKRSAPPTQLANIVAALISALQFEQRTATGSTIGTNVRDAANFGIWSLSRRYTTKELLSVDPPTSSTRGNDSRAVSVVQHVATELVLSACLDPAGNVRRGSSAALQELIGRHPNQVKQGINLVQTVDYQAVGLRSRAMIDVAASATELDSDYVRPVQEALFGWRGLGCPDVASREAAARSLAKLAAQSSDQATVVARAIIQQATETDTREQETWHGLMLTFALVLEDARRLEYGMKTFRTVSYSSPLLSRFDLGDFSSRTLRSEVPVAVARMLAAYCELSVQLGSAPNSDSEHSLPSEADIDTIDRLTERLLARGEENIREGIPSLVRSLLKLKRKVQKPLGCLDSQTLVKQVAIDGAKSTLHGAGRAMALGALAPLYESGLQGSKAAEIVSTLGSLTQAMNVEWRIICIRALQIAVEGCPSGQDVDSAIASCFVSAVHHGMIDYTIDERGDIGSLVRLQAIACTSSVFARFRDRDHSLDEDPLRVLHADILRLSLEKLDRVRLAAAKSQSLYLGGDPGPNALDIAAVSSFEYFERQFQPLATTDRPEWMFTALLEGAISATGISSESLLQASRAALAEALDSTSSQHLCRIMTVYTIALQKSFAHPTSPLTTPALTLLAFLLDMRIPQRLPSPPFKWLNLLSAVQKSHHKSNDIPKIAAAVAVYRGLAEVEMIRGEVLKKLLGMLRTNPYPKVRVLVAEAVFIAVGDEKGEAREFLRKAEWMGDRKANEQTVRDLEKTLL